MRILTIIFAIFVFNSSFSQDTAKKYTFKEVGWTIVLPLDFTTIDSLDDANRNERGKKSMEDANRITADISQTKTLISATKNTYNYFNSTVTPFDPLTDGNYETSVKYIKDIVYKTYFDKMTDAKIDSSTTIVTIDGLSFDQFQVTVHVNDKLLFDMFLLTKFYKGYSFGISYLCLDLATKQQIESMLRTSKFDK